MLTGGKASSYGAQSIFELSWSATRTAGAISAKSENSIIVVIHNSQNEFSSDSTIISILEAIARYSRPGVVEL